jgi:tetratricopeptide (TPR) repeat protein
MRDALDNVVTVDSAEALRLLDKAIQLQVYGWPGALEAAQEATRLAPPLAVGHAMQALIHAAWARRAESNACIELALAHARGTSRREQSLIELLVHVVNGRTHAALACALVHARQFPTDLLALATAAGAYGLFAFSGRDDHDEARFHFLEDAAPHFPSDFPWLLANRGWARIERGAVDEGLAMAREAMALRRENSHGAHIVAHGLHESGRFDEEVAFVDDWIDGYPGHGLMWGHLQWHAAIGEIAGGREADALRRTAGPILDYLPRGTPYMGLADICAILWRLGIRGHRELAWQAAFDHAATHFPRGGNPFAELHLAMLAAVRRDQSALAEVDERARKKIADGQLGGAAIIEWTRGLALLADGDIAGARERLAECERVAVRLGGSGAQRSVIADTIRAMDLPVA